MNTEAKQPMPTNPKDLLGTKKVSITKVPPIALLHMAHAMMDGGQKYGPYNWRENAVKASVYVDAALRHLLAFWERERNATDSGCHHLGHAMACCAILLDAEATGNLVDDRPPSGDNQNPFADVLATLNQQITMKAGGAK